MTLAYLNKIILTEIKFQISGRKFVRNFFLQSDIIVVFTYEERLYDFLTINALKSVLNVSKRFNKKYDVYKLSSLEVILTTAIKSFCTISLLKHAFGILHKFSYYFY